MTFSIPRRSLMIGASALLLARPAFAQTVHDVEMLNADPNNPRVRNVYSPRVLSIQPGDTVRFLSVNPGHNAQSINGMTPAGGETFRGRINEEIEVTLTVPGIYGYQCLPHYSTGMVGLIVVEGDGKLDNLAEAQGVRHRGLAARVFDEIWAEAEAAGLLS